MEIFFQWNEISFCNPIFQHEFSKRTNFTITKKNVDLSMNWLRYLNLEHSICTNNLVLEFIACMCASFWKLPFYSTQRSYSNRNFKKVHNHNYFNKSIIKSENVFIAVRRNCLFCEAILSVTETLISFQDKCCQKRYLLSLSPDDKHLCLYLCLYYLNTQKLNWKILLNFQSTKQITQN